MNIKHNMAYVLFNFPIPNMPYILKEITDLMDLGNRPVIISFDKPGHKNFHEDYYRYGLDSKTIYIPHHKLLNGDLVSPPRTLRRTLKELLFNHQIDAGTKWRLFKLCQDSKLGRVLSMRRFLACIDIIRLCKEHSVQLLYVHLGNEAHYLLPVFKILDVSLVTYFHGMDFSAYPKAGMDYTELFSRGDAFFTVSTYAVNELIKLGCPREKLSIFKYVDAGKFNYVDRKPGQTVKILSVGRLAEKKGFEYSIRAIAKIIEKGATSIVYDIIGEGPMRSRLESVINDLEVGDRVRLLGFKTQDDVVRHMSESHIFVLPSITAASGDTEGVGSSLLEAQLTGMPVVATRHNGLTDAVDDGRSGFLVPERDVDSLTERLQYLIDNTAVWNDMGLNGRKFVLDRFDKDKAIAGFIQAVNDIPLSRQQPVEAQTPES